MLMADLAAELAAVANLGEPELRSAGAEPELISDVVHDSRRVQPGSLFCAVPGFNVDGHDFVPLATERGAAAVMVDRWVETTATQIRVDDVRQAMPWAAAAVHGHPSHELAVFGITGTNGKTTTTQILADILDGAGRRTETIGTLVGVHTTPEASDLQRQLRQAVRAGIDVVVSEVSSHALDQHRVDGTRFAVVAFSNLSPDHLDYHNTLEEYFDAKRRLFDGRAEIELINVDDPWGDRLAAQRPDAARISLADVTILRSTLHGTSFAWRGHECRVPLPGEMNVANALMAMEAALRLGLNEAEVVKGLGLAKAVPGRMQVVATDNQDAPTVIVDYSHTPASITKALATIRPLVPNGQIHIVFGCGGDRDRTKRPMMGAAAERGADRVIVTSDNPRSEDPDAIINEAVRGMRTPQQAFVVADRRRAIELAITEASAGDVVLIAGKGHEKTQTIGSTVLPFDDVAVAAEVLESGVDR